MARVVPGTTNYVINALWQSTANTSQGTPANTEVVLRDPLDASDAAMGGPDFNPGKDRRCIRIRGTATGTGGTRGGYFAAGLGGSPVVAPASVITVSCWVWMSQGVFDKGAQFFLYVNRSNSSRIFQINVRSQITPQRWCRVSTTWIVSQTDTLKDLGIGWEVPSASVNEGTYVWGGQLELQAPVTPLAGFGQPRSTQNGNLTWTRPSVNEQDIQFTSRDSQVSVEVWTCKADGTTLDLLTEARHRHSVVDGIDIEFNPDRAISGSCRLELNDLRLVDTLKTFFRPFVTLTSDYTGQSQRYAMGVFRAAPDNSTFNVTDQGVVATGSVNGDDLTVLLRDSVIRGGYTMNATTTIVPAIRNLIINCPVLDGSILKHSITSSNATLRERKTWPKGVSRLEVINFLLQKIGYYTIWCDRAGVLRSSPYLILNDQTVSHVYTLGQDGQLTEPVVTTPNYNGFGNIVNVVRDSDNETDEIRVLLINDDPKSPTSTKNIGERPIEAITSREFSDANAVMAAARQALNTATSIYQPATFTTFLEPDHDSHEVYRINFGPYGGRDATSLDGFWKLGGIRHRITPGNEYLTEHNVNRTVPYVPRQVI